MAVAGHHFVDLYGRRGKLAGTSPCLTGPGRKISLLGQDLAGKSPYCIRTIIGGRSIALLDQDSWQEYLLIGPGLLLVLYSSTFFKDVHCINHRVFIR